MPDAIATKTTFDTINLRTLVFISSDRFFNMNKLSLKLNFEQGDRHMFPKDPALRLASMRVQIWLRLTATASSFVKLKSQENNKIFTKNILFMTTFA